MMASKTFSGQLDQAMDELAAEGNKILFIPQQNVGEVLEGAASEMTVESDGTYSIKLAYNTYSIYHYSDVTKRKRLLADGIVVSSETSVTTIPGLIGSTVPVTEDSVLTIQGYLDEANEAKTDAETAQAATEALFDDFDSSVAGSMALVHTETPSLSAPFNESGRLDYGVGTEYVSGLPVYGVDFTRSTSCYYINKSGLLTYADIDEIAISSDGVTLEEASTNLLEYSQVCGTNWNAYGSGNATYSLNSSETTDPMGTYTSTKITQSVADDSRYGLSGAISTTVSGDTYTGSVFVKPVDGISVSLNLVTLTGGTTEASSYTIDPNSETYTKDYGADGTARSKYLGNGWYRVSLTVAFSEAGNTSIRFDNGISVLNSGSAYFYGAQVEKTGVATSYIPTEGGVASRTATSCTVPVNGNLPASGESFTFVFDAEFPDSTDTYIVFTVNSDVSGGAILFRKYNGIIQWFHDRDDGTDANLTTSNDSYAVGRHRYSLTFDGSSFAMYCDGVLVNSRTPDDFCWFDVDGYLYFSSSYNNQLKNFKILPYAASADEVKSWGAPK